VFICGAFTSEVRYVINENITFGWKMEITRLLFVQNWQLAVSNCVQNTI